ncbi:MAG: hypothetical protein V1674_05955 [Candidatus Omnitrophota bacterium]
MRHLSYILIGWIFFAVFRFFLCLLVVIKPYLAKASDLAIESWLKWLPGYLFYNNLTAENYWLKFALIIFIFWAIGFLISFTVNKFIE